MLEEKTKDIRRQKVRRPAVIGDKLRTPLA